MEKTKLMSKAQVLMFLEENGEHEPSLAKLSDIYDALFGIDPIWRYPLSDDMHSGAFIIPVQEGYLWLPYDEVDHEYYEILLPGATTMLDAECCSRFAKTLCGYAADLYSVLSTIHGEIAPSDEVRLEYPPFHKAVPEASELVRALLRDDDVNPCEWCGVPFSGSTAHGCEECGWFTGKNQDKILFALAFPM